MNQARLENELMTILHRHVPEGTKITMHSTILGDLALDSVAVMEVIADVEDSLSLSIPDEALEGLETVGDVIRALEQRLEGNESGA